jgi:hypothetical protein
MLRRVKINTLIHSALDAEEPIPVNIRGLHVKLAITFSILAFAGLFTVRVLKMNKTYVVIKKTINFVAISNFKYK